MCVCLIMGIVCAGCAGVSVCAQLSVCAHCTECIYMCVLPGLAL